MKTAIYIRVSTEEQAKEGYSIPAQRNRLEAFCVSQGWDVMGYYVDDGKSAKDTNREELQRMIKHIEEGFIECVLVYRLDRLTRSVRDLYDLLDIFEKHNCKFKSATEVYDTTTSMGRLFITIVAALAQWERENLGERVKMGMQEKASEGKWVMNLPPYGYEIDKENDTLKIIESEAITVRKIFKRYIDGLGCAKIARELNRLHVATKKQGTWSQTTIRQMLRNPVYIGTIRYNYRVNKENYFEVEDAVPAILDTDIYEKVQVILNKRKTSHPRAATSEYIFSGTAVCARCGAPLAGKYGVSKRGDKEYPTRSYYCTKAKNGLCDQRQISQRYIEDRFLEKIETLSVTDAHIDLQEKPDQSKEKVARINKELKDIEKRRKKWQYAWANEVISDKEFKEIMKEEKEKEDRLINELHEIKPPEKGLPIEERKEILKNIKLNWQNLTVIEKKTFLQMFVKKITVDRIANAQKPTSIAVDIEF